MGYRINDLIETTSVAASDELELQLAGGGSSRRVTVENLVGSSNAATLAALKARTDLDGTVYLVGRIAAGDGGGGVFLWDSSDLSTEVTTDTLSGIYVAPTSDPTGASGAWVRQYSGSLSVKCFGAKGNGVVNDTDSFVAACAMSNNVYAPAGHYILSNLELFGKLNSFILSGDGAKQTILDFSAGTSGDGLIVGENVTDGGCKNVSLRDLQITDSSTTSSLDSLLTLKSGPVGASPSRTTGFVDLKNVILQDFNSATGTGVVIDGLSHVHFDDVFWKFGFAGKYGLKITASTDLNTGVFTFNNCYVSGDETALLFYGDENLLDSFVFNGCGFFSTSANAAETIVLDGTSGAISSVAFNGCHLENRHASQDAAVLFTGAIKAISFRNCHLSVGDGTDNNNFAFKFSAAVLNACSFDSNEFLRVDSSGACFRFENDCTMSVTEPITIQGVWRNATTPVVISVESGGGEHDIWNCLAFDDRVSRRKIFISDNGVVSFEPPQSEGVITISPSNATSAAGKTFYRAESTAYVAAIGGGASFEVTTGALIGTTGTDTKLTVSAHTDGKIYIENRLGYDNYFAVYFSDFYNASQ